MRSISSGGQPCMVERVTEWTGEAGKSPRRARALRRRASAPKAAAKSARVDEGFEIAQRAVPEVRLEAGPARACPR